MFRILVQTNNENADGMATPHIRIPLVVILKIVYINIEDNY